MLWNGDDDERSLYVSAGQGLRNRCLEHVIYWAPARNIDIQITGFEFEGGDLTAAMRPYLQKGPWREGQAGLGPALA